MSFYTALTGLNGSSADISATSNNIANVGTTGFKRSRVEFGDIFATSPLQNASSSIGSGTILKGIKQQFTQGNIAASLNALDLAISGQGFFALKPSLTSAQTVYTRNGSLNVNNDRYVVDSAGQYLLTYPVNTDGSVTAKDLDSAVPLQLPVTSGDPQATSNIKLGVNVNAASDVVTDRPQFQDGYSFDPNDPETFTNSTSITIFDDLGNPTIATVYFIKTQAASADDPTNKYDTRLVINDTIINPDLVSAVDDAGKQIFVDRFGQQTTSIPDDNYFIEGKGSPLYKLDDLQTLVPSQPAKISGEASSFDFGEEGDKLVEIVTDPLRFASTREGGNTAGDMYWGQDFLLVNVDESDQPVSIDINPGLYNAQQLAAEVERAINAAYGDDRKIQVEQNLDNKISFNFERVGADGSPSQLDNPIEVELLGINSFVTEKLAADPNADFAITGTSPDFTKEEFLSHAQIRINETLNEYGRQYSDDPMGVGDLQYVKTKGEAISTPYEYTQVVTLERTDSSADPHYLVYSYADKTPSISVASVMHEVSGDSQNTNVEYDSTNDRLRIYLGHSGQTSTYGNIDISNYEQNGTVTLAGNAGFSAALNGRTFTILEAVEENGVKYIDVSTSGLTIGDATIEITNATDLYVLTNPSTKPSKVEAFFEGSAPIYPGANERFYSNKIILREKQGNDADTTTGSFVATNWNITNQSSQALASDTSYTEEATETLAQKLENLGLQNLHRPALLREPALSTGDVFNVELVAGTDTLTVQTDALTSTAAGDGLTALKDKLAANQTDLKGFSFTFVNAAGETLFSTAAWKYDTDGSTVIPNTVNSWRSENQTIFSASQLGLTTPTDTDIAEVIISRDDNVDFTIAGGSNQNFTASVDGEDAAGFSALTTTAVTTDVLTNSSVDWVDELDPAVSIGYDAVNQRLSFQVDRTVLGSGTSADFTSFTVYGSSDQTGVNGLGLTNADNAPEVPIRGGEILHGDSFVATGEEIQPNDKRYGISVEYNSELQNFTISSGTTGEAISANGAIGVSEQQKASNIQIGRYLLNEKGIASEQPYDVDAVIIGNGDNSLFGVGSTKNDFLFTTGTGLKATPAEAVGATANEPLSNVFKLSSQTGDNVFNVSVNGINGIVEVPATSYVGTTLAEALETRINQIVDPTTGETIGGVRVTYNSDTNNFKFSTGTTGSDSTIKVKGSARLGLADVPLGVGSVPEIYNLVQATNAEGAALYVDANGEVVTNAPDPIVEGYYPLYIDEGELTFDKTGKLLSPKNLVHYEKQEEGFSIALDIDFSTSTQLAQPFSVLTVEQDGFTSGRLDGIEIDSSGTIRANYTNGQNNPLGKIVVANFNNQNGLKQIGNATYTETAVSGTPQVGEAGSEGFGNILSGSLERSNVDITEELVNLITAQRNFQASAKAIETTTGLTQTIINIRM